MVSATITMATPATLESIPKVGSGSASNQDGYLPVASYLVSTGLLPLQRRFRWAMQPGGSRRLAGTCRPIFTSPFTGVPKATGSALAQDSTAGAGITKGTADLPGLLPDGSGTAISDGHRPRRGPAAPRGKSRRDSWKPAVKSHGGVGDRAM